MAKKNQPQKRETVVTKVHRISTAPASVSDRAAAQMSSLTGAVLLAAVITAVLFTAAIITGVQWCFVASMFGVLLTGALIICVAFVPEPSREEADNI